MLNDDGLRGNGSPRAETSLAAAILMLFLGLLASAIWSLISPTPIAVFSALVQTGFVTRLAFLGLFFGGAFGLFTFRTVKRGWSGHVQCIIALATAWSMFERLAVRIQAVDGLALAAAGYLLARGLVSTQEGHNRADVVLPGDAARINASGEVGALGRGVERID
jgi:hypothetical protein